MNEETGHVLQNGNLLQETTHHAGVEIADIHHRVLPLGHSLGYASTLELAALSSGDADPVDLLSSHATIESYAVEHRCWEMQLGI